MKFTFKMAKKYNELSEKYDAETDKSYWMA
ncbi:hypothetical protein DYBT9275_02567 [Dyadobacter sp. CECT 9275]|uniref:Uncharacterized protein n=1 Tax=Dyadobacter helix TaxID=2822344 RepID=A0A916N610_9BACT|nr:hypothetical protein DYBT9275_02567 [Dyadobacter sp. CECT 9275]